MNNNVSQNMLKSLFLNETVFEFNIPTHIQAQ